MRVLTWNLFHGRAVPPRRARPARPSSPPRSRGWDWDVALLQEVPPWWPPALARALRAPTQRTALTSRNALLRAAPLRRAARARPHQVKRRRRQRDPRAGRRGRRSPRTAACCCAAGPSGASATPSRCGGGAWVREPPRAGPLRAARAGRHRARGGGDAGVGRRRGRRCSAATSTSATPVAPGFAHLAGHGVDHVLGRGLARGRRARDAGARRTLRSCRRCSSASCCGRAPRAANLGPPRSFRRTMYRCPIIALACRVLALALGACGDDKESDTGRDAGEDGATVTTTPTPRGSDEHPERGTGVRRRRQRRR